MSIVTKDTIKTICEINGITNVDDEVLNFLSRDVEYRLREVSYEAKKFMDHGKRSKLSSDDINNSLKVKNIESLYGYGFKDPLNFVRVSGISGLNDKGLYYLEDKELNFKDVISSPLPNIPRESNLQLHWLAIEGVQPQTPQNPIIKSSEEVEKMNLERSKVKSDKDNVKIKPSVRHTLSKEAQEYYLRVTEIIKDLNPSNEIKNTDKMEEVNEIDSPFYNLSERIELRDPKFLVVISSIGEDPGLHQLVPYFSRFIASEVANQLHNLPLLLRLMRVVEALLKNPYIRIELYLHQILPAIISCMVAKRVCEDESENHWELRDYAADLVGKICYKYGKYYKDLRPRITKNLLHAFLDPNKALTTHYGAIKGLSSLGTNSIQLVLIPNIAAYIKLIKPKLESENPQEKNCAMKCYETLLEICGNFFRTTAEQYLSIKKNTSMEQNEFVSLKKLIESQEIDNVIERYKELVQIFGEPLLLYMNEDLLSIFNDQQI